MNNKVMTVDINVGLLDELVEAGVGINRLDALSKAFALVMTLRDFKDAKGNISIVDDENAEIIELKAFIESRRERVKSNDAASSTQKNQQDKLATA